MTKRELIDYCLVYFDCYEDYPFDTVTAVMKLSSNHKMFCLIAERSGAVYINLKCDPDEAIELREQFEGITEGYHMNKKHWNTVVLESDVPFELLERMIARSYHLVKPKGKRAGKI